jgi:transcription initiation factor IIE alpha subunit
MNNNEIERLQAKTPEQRFLHMLEAEFHYAPKVAQAILEEAQSCLLGSSDQLRPGQVRVVLTKREAGHGRALRETATTEVVWTIDAGLEDRQVLQAHDAIALRQVRLQRLLDEALDQGAAAVQEDLAQALQVSVRTIKRDFAALQAQGIFLPTRGKLHGIGRGQTHKPQIVGRWLKGETYDQIQLHTRHALSSIKRYIQTFVRVVHLHRQGFSNSQIAQLLGISEALVEEYLAVYHDNDTPECRKRLDEQLQRLIDGPARLSAAAKGGL